tara:strand:- start:336 stop:647 length:312 start_codon:yes stop_codon:yes gene_type:complete
MKTQINQTALFTAVIMVCCIIKRSDIMFSSLRLINAIIEHADEQGLPVEEFFFETEKEMGAHLLWDKHNIEHDISLEVEMWEDVDLLSKARWTKLAIVEFKLR